MNYRPKAIDLFSGAGGMSLGFEQAGFDICAAVEIDPVHACAHHFNFPKSTTICENISDLSGKDILGRASVPSKESIDLVFGGAPCQGYSMIGQRALDDPRNSLVRDYIRIISQIKPKAFVFENVKGITLGKHKQILDEFIDKVNAIGYEIISPWKVLNANKYGVPQSRERLFIIGFLKNSKGTFLYPEQITKPQAEGADLFVELTPTCKDALDDLPDIDEFEQLKKVDWVEIDCSGSKSDYARKMRLSNERDWKYGHRRVWNSNVLTSSMRTKHTDISKRRFREAEEGKPEPISRLFKLPRAGQSNTLRAGTDSSRGAFSSPRPIHYDFERVISIREMARLHSFPDWFRFHATKWHGGRQVGNAVPPLLAYHVGLSIMRGLQEKPEPSSTEIKLGNPELLTFTLEQACKYWGVKNPISKRNMKSGARKRKQEVIERERLQALAL